ncbi:unnamed protein product [Adineta steineri]|uniref:Uncharacterized protein n=1 Tax=Adineta steineri TaxID=433720 RepID=A0A814G1I2_9BILA|nr:unnamed protein product [Adineta steineri]CAF4063912.1 unnamed protein product [Adineta steineri]
MGGSCSKCCATVVIPTNISFNQISVVPGKSSSSKSTRFVENCIVIWLFDDPSRKFDNEKEQLRRLVYGLQVFANADICIDYIRDIQDEKIFLITSVTYQSIINFYHLPQLEKIYIFDTLSHDDNKRNLQHNVFRDMNNLCKQLEEDIELCEFDLLCFSTFFDDTNSSITLTKEQIGFVFIHILNEIMARMKYESNAKNVFIDFCRICYENNDEQLRIIDEFEKYYRPHKALDWLKRPCFISKILNRIKRTHEIDIVYKLGFFLKHLNMQLIHLHEENALLMKNISIVYRGKTMLNDEFELLMKNSCHGLLSFTNFLGTSINKENMIDFIRRRLAIHPDRIGILFEIHLDSMIYDEKNPFALLNDNDSKNSEIYFDTGCVFRIESIEQFNEDLLMMWCVKLRLIRNDDPQLLRIVEPFRTEEQHENPLSCLGKLLMNMGEYKRVEQCFLETLNDASILSQPRRLVRARIGLGANYSHKGEYITALIHYEQALKISLTYLPSDHYNLAPIYKSIGDCYLNQNNYENALTNYERAIHLIESNTQSPKSSTITELQNLINKTKQLIENNKSLLLTKSQK